MLVLTGFIIVTVSVFGGFIMAGGHPNNLIQVSEFVVICGAALGAMVTVAPEKVFIDPSRRCNPLRLPMCTQVRVPRASLWSHCNAMAIASPAFASNASAAR